MEKLIKKELSNRLRIFLTLAFFFFLGLAVFSVTQILTQLREYVYSESEYDKLREIYEPSEERRPVIVSYSEEDILFPNLPDLDIVEEEALTTDPKPTAPPRDPAEVNEDYIGWLKTSGNINYPIVKGEDNDKYLKTSFEGNKNALGAIFMDYRCSGDFSGYHSIIYGHNAKNGSMFGSLAKYLGAAYMEKNREITVTLPDGKKETWLVFAARKSDITDHSFRVAFSGPESFAAFAADLGAPEGATRILTLSTCTSGGSKDDRMLVHAAITGIEK